MIKKRSSSRAQSHRADGTPSGLGHYSARPDTLSNHTPLRAAPAPHSTMHDRENPRPTLHPTPPTRSAVDAAVVGQAPLYALAGAGQCAASARPAAALHRHLRRGGLGRLCALSVLWRTSLFVQ